MRNALPVLALAALLAGPALAIQPGPPQSEQNPGPPTSPGTDVQVKEDPPIAPGAAPGENKLLPAVQAPGMAGMEGMAGNQLPAVQAPTPGMVGGNLPAVQAPNPGAAAGIQPGSPIMPGGIGGMGAAGFRH